MPQIRLKDLEKVIDYTHNEEQHYFLDKLMDLNITKKPLTIEDINPCLNPKKLVLAGDLKKYYSKEKISKILLSELDKKPKSIINRKNKKCNKYVFKYSFGEDSDEYTKDPVKLIKKKFLKECDINPGVLIELKLKNKQNQTENLQKKVYKTINKFMEYSQHVPIIG